MKKIMYIAAALLVLAGCSNKEENGTQNAPANYGTITGKIELPQGDGAQVGARKITAPNGWKTMTEAFTMQWESTDKIYIYNQSGCKELAVKSIDAQTGNATFEGELLDNMSSYNVAYGYNPTAGTTAFAVDYIADNYRPFADGTGEYKIFTIDNFGPVMGLKLQGNAKVGKIEVVALKGDAAQATYTMTLETAIELNTETVAKVYFPLNQLGDADKLEAKFYPGESVLKTQAFVTLPAKNMVTTYPAIEVNDPYNGHAYVDLGLSVKWATCNVGASKPEEYGDYFAWGETSPKTTFNWGNYKYMQNGKSDWEYITKYTIPDNQKSGIWYNEDTFIGDNKTVLDLADDAAHVNWGSSWRMPTKAELEELKDPQNCEWVWQEDYNSTGVKGYLVKSLKEGYTDNSIFLPAAGYRSHSLYDVSVYGYFWSSSLGKNESFRAYNFYFVSSNRFFDSVFRDLGRSVRPVCE